MAPSSSHQVWVWSLPTLAFLLSLLWYRRKRAAALRSDPGGTTPDSSKNSESCKQNVCVSLISKSNKEQTVSYENHLTEYSVEEEREAEILHEVKREPVLEERSKCTSISSVSEGVSVSYDSESGPVYPCIHKFDVEIQQLSSLDILVKSVSEEPEITILENTTSEALENPKCFFDKISPIDSTQHNQTYRENDKKSVALPDNNNLKEDLESTSYNAGKFSLSTEIESSEIVSDNDVVRELSCEEISLESQITYSNLQTVESTDDYSSEYAQIFQHLNVLDTIRDTALLVCEEKEESEESFNIVKMARKLSAEASSMEKHSHEEESDKKLSSEGATLNGVSISLENKLSSVEVGGNFQGEASSEVESVSTKGPVAGRCGAGMEHHRTERDSANHSPVDIMLASPSMSSYSDVQSEGSSDSGKGCSDVVSPPSRTPASGSSLSGDVPLRSVYEFVLPQHLVGRLIGRHGCFVHQIKAKTNASILIKRHPDTQKLKICAVEGTQADIDSALEMIRQKFPEKRYPNVTLEQVSFLPPVPTFPLIPDFLQLHLVEGVNNDVILSSLVSTAHFFLQQPTHPTFPALNRLNACMNMCYSVPSTPLLPMPTQAGVICVAPAMEGWYRAQVVAADPESETCDIKFVDYGGYMTVECSVLRQIRSDFMTLPFQASECYLANIAPVGGEEWSKESYTSMEELTHGQVLQAQIFNYSEDSLPIVYLYAIHNSQVVLVNQELVSRGYAEWIEAPEA